jgi:hypothetical protein
MRSSSDRPPPLPRDVSGWCARRAARCRGRSRQQASPHKVSIALELRWAEGQYDRLPSLAVELVRLKVNIIVAAGPSAVQAAKQATEDDPDHAIRRRVPAVFGASEFTEAGGPASGLRRPRPSPPRRALAVVLAPDNAP